MSSRRSPLAARTHVKTNAIVVRRAEPSDAPTVVAIVHEAAAWLRAERMTLWTDQEIRPDLIEASVAAGIVYLAEHAGEPAGTLQFQLADPETWPDLPDGESAFVHRLAIRRRFAGGTVSNAMLDWAVRRARAIGREFLRLDCEADRPKLKAFYEGFGFRFHSEFQLGPYRLARYEIRTGAGRDA